MADRLDGLSLQISEIYASVQGESTFAGRPCVFVRTTGCPLRCVWCDTEHAFSGGRKLAAAAVVDQVLALELPLVELTGGEPLAQKNVLPLITALVEAGRQVLIETSGAYDIAPVDPRARVIMDLKCPDSGEQSRNRWSNIDRLEAKDEVKFVLASRRDYDFAKATIAKYALHRRCEVLISTVFASAAKPQAVVEWILSDKLPVRFQLQLHKLIWGPDTVGV